MKKTTLSFLIGFFVLLVNAFSISESELVELEAKAMSGDARSIRYLGEIYESGDGVPADTHIARHYYLVAARLGDSVSAQKLGLRKNTSNLGVTTEYTVEFEEGVKMEFLPIPAGTFMLGSPDNEDERQSDEEQVRVTLSAFLLGKTEVTQAQWSALMGKNPSNFNGGTLPVEKVSWEDAMRFCEKLTARERSAGRLPETMVFTLPTEAQWEYACRAGTTSRFHSGDADSSLSRAGWFGENWEKGKTHPVGQKIANKWGLYDMHGNVWEWCLDYYNPSRSGGVDPEASIPGLIGERRVNRGGSWLDLAPSCRSAKRRYDSPRFRGSAVGFRVALVQAEN